MVIYRIENEHVDPVFFPVVPDSFMDRSGAASVADRRRSDLVDWPEEIDRPFVSPRDRWSF